MAHVELSLSEPISGSYDPDSTSHQLLQQRGLSSVDHWSLAARDAPEPCLVIDASASVAAVSQAACDLLGFPAPEHVIGCFLHTGDLLALVDFTPASAALSEADLEKIPPVLALRTGRLARGLMRVRSGDEVITMDAVATPLWHRGRVAGSLTFFSPV